MDRDDLKAVGWFKNEATFADVRKDGGIKVAGLLWRANSTAWSRREVGCSYLGSAADVRAHKRRKRDVARVPRILDGGDAGEKPTIDCWKDRKTVCFVRWVSKGVLLWMARTSGAVRVMRS